MKEILDRTFFSPSAFQEKDTLSTFTAGEEEEGKEAGKEAEEGEVVSGWTPLIPESTSVSSNSF